MKVDMKRARECVREKTTFRGNNVYALWHSSKEGGPCDLYVVCSYGAHWPLYVYEQMTGVWYRNTEKSSPTTSCHSTQLHPGVPCVDIEKNEDMTSLAFGGVVYMIEAREDRRRMRAVHDTFTQNIRRHFSNFNT
jgi:hypothetical protein